MKRPGEPDPRAVEAVRRVLADSADREHLDTGDAIEALRGAEAALRADRVYLHESEERPGGGGAYPFSVVLCYLRGRVSSHSFATWIRVIRPGDSITAEGHYMDTAREAGEDYEARCQKMGLEPYPREIPEV